MSDWQSPHTAFDLFPYFALTVFLFGMHTVLMARMVLEIRSTRRTCSRGKLLVKSLCISMYLIAAVSLCLAAVLISGSMWSAYCLADYFLRVTSPPPLSAWDDYDLPCSTRIVMVQAGSFAVPVVEGSQPAVFMAPRILSRLLAINMAISDIIVIWRAWVLWQRQRAVKIVSIALLLAAFGSMMYGIIMDASMGTKGLPSIHFSLLTNIWSTGLISWKSWKHRRLMRRTLGPTSERTQMEKVLLLFVESGFIYALMWTFVAMGKVWMFCSWAVAFPDGPWRYVNAPEAADSTDMVDALELDNPQIKGFFNFINYLMACGLIEFVSLYPAVVVLLAGRTTSYYNRTLELESVRMPNRPQSAHLATLSMENLSDSEGVLSVSPTPSSLPVDELPEVAPKAAPVATVTIIDGVYYISALQDEDDDGEDSGAIHSAFYAEP